MAMRMRNIITLFRLRSSAEASIASCITPPFGNHISRSFSEALSKPRSNLISLLRRYAFPTNEIQNFLNNNHVLAQTPLEIEKSFQLLLSLNTSRDFLISTVIGCPSILCLDFLENWQLGITQLGIGNITSSDAVRNILEIARKLGLTPDDVSRRLKGFKHLGLSYRTITRVLEIVPMVIMSGEDHIGDKIEFLLKIGIQDREIDRVVCLFPEILALGMENRLNPLIQEFRDLGFNFREIRGEVVREPRVLGLENGELSHCMEMLRSLKCRQAIKEDIFREGEFRAGYRAKLRVDCLRKHGLMYRDAFKVLWKEPRVILYEIKDIEKKIDFLVHKMKFDVECLVEVPEYLGVNFDKQIIPRFSVVEYLRSVGGLGDEVGLRTLVKLSRLRFYNMYVKPYPECQKMYGRLGGDARVHSRHPVGMWKHFLPQKYTISDQDKKNIKSHMESIHQET